MNIHNWLSQTTASDVMVRKIATLSTDSTLSQAATVMLREGTTGAPIIDSNGKCIGVISATDFLHAEQDVLVERERIAQNSFWSSDLALPAGIYEQKLAEVRDRLLPASEQSVERFMTRNLVTVSGETPLETCVQMIVDAHIHRLLVLGKDDRLVGILTTTDILAALLRTSRMAEYV